MTSHGLPKLTPSLAVCSGVSASSDEGFGRPFCVTKGPGPRDLRLVALVGQRAESKTIFQFQTLRDATPLTSIPL